MTRVVLTAVIAPPPHLVKNGARQERMTKTCSVEEVDAAVGEFTRVADRLGVFDSGGALTVLVQREPARPAEQGPG